MDAKKAAQLRAVMTAAFPDAEVTGYEPLVAGMSNDPKARHVAAAAVTAGAQVIVTSNLRDFKLLPSGIEAQSPDDFLCHLFELDPSAFVALLRAQAIDLDEPRVSFAELLGRLRRVVPRFVEAVEQFTRFRSVPNEGEPTLGC